MIYELSREQKRSRFGNSLGRVQPRRAVVGDDPHMIVALEIGFARCQADTASTSSDEEGSAGCALVVTEVPQASTRIACWRSAN